MAGTGAGKKRASAGTKKQFVDLALSKGALAAKVISPAAVATAEWVRWKCRFGCGGYGGSLVCPPHSPTPQQTRAMLDCYRRGIFFESPPGKAKRIAVAVERRLFLDGHYQALGLGCGPCPLCKSCAFDQGCRHPHQARPAMEACGIDVFATARRHGFTINVVRTRRDKPHYFGLVLID